MAANVFLGINQGLAWSMTVVMKIDLVGPRRRGLALGLNEAAGSGGVAVAAAVGELEHRRERLQAVGDLRIVHGGSVPITEPLR